MASRDWRRDRFFSTTRARCDGKRKEEQRTHVAGAGNALWFFWHLVFLAATVACVFGNKTTSVAWRIDSPALPPCSPASRQCGFGTNPSTAKFLVAFGSERLIPSSSFAAMT